MLVRNGQTINIGRPIISIHQHDTAESKAFTQLLQEITQKVEKLHIGEPTPMVSSLLLEHFSAWTVLLEALHQEMADALRMNTTATAHLIADLRQSIDERIAEADTSSASRVIDPLPFINERFAQLGTDIEIRAEQIRDFAEMKHLDMADAVGTISGEIQARFDQVHSEFIALGNTLRTLDQRIYKQTWDAEKAAKQMEDKAEAQYAAVTARMQDLEQRLLDADVKADMKADVNAHTIQESNELMMFALETILTELRTPPVPWYSRAWAWLKSLARRS